MAIDPKRLKDLLTIVEHGSFTRAAAALNVSQPALSNSIAILEQALGVRVLDRDRHGATVTDYGRVLAGYARTLETVLRRADDEIKLKKLGLDGSLAVGVTPIAAATLVPAAIAEIVALTPDVAITVTEAVDDDLIAGLRTGRIDLMVGPIGIDPAQPDIEELPILEDVFTVVLRPEHPLAGRRALTLPALRDAHWVMPEIGTASRRQMQSLFGSAGVAWPRRCIVANSIIAIKAILARTDCVSIMSAQLAAAERDAGYLACIPLKGARYARTIGIRTNRNALSTPLADRFAASLKRAAEMGLGD